MGFGGRSLPPCTQKNPVLHPCIFASKFCFRCLLRAFRTSLHAKIFELIFCFRCTSLSKWRLVHNSYIFLECRVFAPSHIWPRHIQLSPTNTASYLATLASCEVFFYINFTFYLLEILCLDSWTDEWDD